MKLVLNLFICFFKIGAFTFGGGYAMISMVKDTLVDKKKWMDEKDFWDSIALSQALPGVFAINMALYTGYKIAGKGGAAAAAFGAMLPSLIIIAVIASYFADMNNHPIVKSIFSGIRPCVVALIFAPGLAMLKKANITYKTAWLPITACLLICFCGLSPIYVIIGSIVLGIVHQLRTKKIKQ